MLDWSTICFGIGLVLFLLVKWDVLQGVVYSLLFDSMGTSLYLIQEASGDFTERLMLNIGVPVVLIIMKGILAFLIVQGWKRVRGEQRN
ncbi:hypothetical protein JMA_40290 (plasmid) [Jeotgalibacillus malaysiensis]|uniref:Uncharacterized protein n=1 Tax=Jeotgalibacillus malaysiensis TaxID=1508404 RepID=A0A0B5AXE5_9BACL|nr:hypothetical protein [Jeotgalibacillus malaysiensis]AJD93347.1 hypothetical protein JMA_40290 [Jeotgalibacillus malaysiensis]